MSSTSELSGFAARLRESILASEWGARTSVGSNPRAGVADFEALARQLFALQFQHNAPYRRLCEARGARPDTVAHWTDIPAAPTSAFKEFDLSCLPVEQRTTIFHSSGTTGQKPSRHFHNAGSLPLYEASAWAWFSANFNWAIGDWQLAILTPPPSQAQHSSLVHMFETIRRKVGRDGSAFVGKAANNGVWILDAEAALARLKAATDAGQPLLMLGTAFSFVHLLDHLAEKGLRFELPPGSCALETGGYKGRSRSLPKAALHTHISERLGIPPGHIVCEYGMSELSSQAYDLEIGELVATSPGVANSDGSFPLTPALSSGEREPRRPRVQTPGAPEMPARRDAVLPLPEGEGWGEGERSTRPPGATPSAIASERIFRFPSWARVQIISPETGSEVAEGETGLIRLFDLANVYSVMAIQTEDLGIRRGKGFTLAGRAVLAEPRGCSLMAV
jgi:Acyl-protein synthetase, LuxE